MIKGKVISGEFGKIIIRQKSDSNLELGELLIADTKDQKILLQVYSLMYGSQISQQNLELISGLKLEEDNDLEFLDPKLRNYTLAFLKPMLATDNSGFRICKTLPAFFSSVRELQKDDLNFLTQPENPLFIGKLRSGSKTMDFDISLPGDEVFAHHILIPGTTGRGKSVLLKVMLWNILNNDYAGILVLDPHDEYYGRKTTGLKDHQNSDRVVYYTAKFPPPNTKTLKININQIKPQHFNGVVDFSDAQKQALNIYYKDFGSKWIEAIIIERKLQSAVFRDDTLAVVKRRLMYLLNLDFKQNQLFCKGIFDLQAGESTISDICKELEQSKVVIIDTSSFSGNVELLIGSLIATEILEKYKQFRTTGLLDQKPVISIVLEEAPRVLGKEILEKGSNVFETIAREGRKFKVGLTAITQLPSLIPRQILANMNTKIILGIEMKPERQAIIESASQDLSEDDRNIASLDKGEAIITSNFTKFAIPIKIPLFEDIAKQQKQKYYKQDFSGIV
ncbi:ATP-binding protein [Candidatus Woesearchaeota archaeon]|nr:ATP-binding protein [Candidatus Woesearchaeota archaeon]